MPKYIIEREIPGAGKLTEDELKAISRKSCAVLNRPADCCNVTVRMGEPWKS